MLLIAPVLAAVAFSGCGIPNERMRLALDDPSPVVVDKRTGCTSAAEVEGLRQELAMVKDRNQKLEKMMKGQRRRPRSRAPASD
jgi:hypothetical protein